MPAYWVVNLHSSYKISDNLEVFGLVRNLFDRHYYTYGLLTDVTEFGYLNLTDDRTFVPGIPFAAYVGLRGKLPGAEHAFGDPALPLLTKTPPPASWNWTGLYLGINGGYSFGGSDWTDSVTGMSSGNFNTSGFVFGGTLEPIIRPAPGCSASKPTPIGPTPAASARSRRLPSAPEAA